MSARRNFMGARLTSGGSAVKLPHAFRAAGRSAGTGIGSPAASEPGACAVVRGRRA
jgi:hypothetical protein